MQILEHGAAKLDAAYGCSLGGACLTRLLALGELWRSLAALVLWMLPGIVFLFYARTFLRLAPLWLLVYFTLAARLTLALQEPVFKEKP